MLHPSQHPGLQTVAFVMDHAVTLGELATELDHLELAVGETNATIPIRPEDDRLAMNAFNRVLRAAVLLGCVEPHLVIEDVAVLVDLDETRAPVGRTTLHEGGEVLGIDVDPAGDERGVGAEGERQRVQGGIDRAVGRGLGDLPSLARR